MRRIPLPSGQWSVISEEGPSTAAAPSKDEMKVFVFTPTFEREDGSLAMRPECEASVVGQDYEGGMVRVVGTHNPFPGQSHKNVLAQYQRAREMFLASDCGAMLTVEHDVVLPVDGVRKLVESLGRVDYGMRLTQTMARPGVVFGVYMLRHGSLVLNAWEFIGDHAMGESFTIHSGKLREARRVGLVRVSGVGWGCTLMRREVVEAIRFQDGGGKNPAGDIAFAMDCLYRGVVMVANMDVACDHWDGEMRLGAYGGAMAGYIAVEALVDVVVAGEKGSMRMEAGGRYEVGPGLASDLARAGYVRITNGEGQEGRNSAVDPREGEKTGNDVGEGELAAVEPRERAVASKGRRRKGGI